LKRASESAASASVEDELLLELDAKARSVRADSDARRTGAFTVDAEDVACASKAVPAITKLNAAARHAIPKRLR
jgi:hypothetical protein